MAGKHALCAIACALMPVLLGVSALAQTPKSRAMIRAATATQSLFPAVPAGCPTPPNQLAFTVTATTSQNKRTKIWTYSYKVTNSSASVQPLAFFGVAYNPTISNVTSPSGWVSLPFGNRNVNMWAAAAGASLPAGQTDDGNIQPSPFQIPPGGSLSGFSFQSANPPAQVPDFALGFAPLPTAPSGADTEDLADACRSSTGNFFDMAVRGVTSAPGGSVLPVEIDIAPFQSPNDVNLNAGSQIQVAILSTSAFSASTVSASSAKFGPGNAVPLSSPPPTTQDVNGDGLADLVLTYDVASAAIPCGATSATLTASTSGGGTISGSDWVATVNCVMPTPTATPTP